MLQVIFKLVDLDSKLFLFVVVQVKVFIGRLQILVVLRIILFKAGFLFF